MGMTSWEEIPLGVRTFYFPKSVGFPILIPTEGPSQGKIEIISELISPTISSPYELDGWI
jgi:hypothetical protein